MGLYHLINVALKYKDISSIAPYLAHYHCNVNKDFHGRFIYKIPSELEIKNLKKMSCMNESMTYMNDNMERLNFDIVKDDSVAYLVR